MKEIVSRCENGIFEIEIDRPSKKNALTEAMYLELTKALIAAENDSSVKVILLYGQPFCFTAGNDLKDFLENPPLGRDATVFKMLRQFAHLTKPLILAVNGAAIGIGTTICFHADLVYCGESTKFQLPFVRLGLVPEFASSLLLPKLAGHAKAFEYMVLGEAFNAETALNIGMINGIYKDETYLTAAKQKAVELAALPSAAVIESKRLLKKPILDSILKAIDDEADVFAKLLVSPEAKAKFDAFLKK